MMNFVDSCHRSRGETGQGMVETALVMGLIAILMVSTIWIFANWAGTKFNEEATSSSKQGSFDEAMTDLSGSVTVNSTTVATTSTISGGM